MKALLGEEMNRYQTCIIEGHARHPETSDAAIRSSMTGTLGRLCCCDPGGVDFTTRRMVRTVIVVTVLMLCIFL